MRDCRSRSEGQAGEETCKGFFDLAAVFAGKDNTEALKKAVSRARADADTVAGALGTVISDVKIVDISGGYSPVLFENYQATGDAMKSTAPTPIQPGDITVSATVSITYLIR